ncbi:MAG: hypothetical protein M9894_38670 [Planctomycetes bacterium]|nr:hypothetical protein [Planctomycetota bacterium]
METEEPSSGVKAAAKRILKDSGRFLLAGVKAALAGPTTPSDFLLDAWRQGQHELHLEAVDLGQLVTGCLARHTSACADKGIDLLLQQGEQVPRVMADRGYVEAVLDKALEAARNGCAQNRPLRVRLGHEGDRAWVAISGEVDAAPAFDEPPAALEAAGEVMAAHGGALVIDRADPEQVSLVLRLPAAPLGPN